MSYGVSNFRDRLVAGELRAVLLGVGVALLFVAPFLLGGFQTKLLAETLVFAIFATAFNLLYGYTGLLSFGHAMFIAAAGYTAAKVVNVVAPALGVPELFGGLAPLVTVIVMLALGMLIAALLAVFIGYLAVQLEEIYFAMITLSFSMAIWAVFNQDIIGSLLAELGLGNGVFSNGSDGITFIISEGNLFGFTFDFGNLVDPLALYFAILVLFIGAMLALYRIVRSPFGMTCKAIRENPGRAEALGINVTRHSWATFIVSGAFSGLAGVLYIMLQGGARPDFAYWTFSAEPVIMTVIGGPYAFLGGLVGAFTYEYLRWGISQFPLLEEYWQFSFGVLLLLVVLFFNNGVSGGLQRLSAWLGVARSRYAADGVSGVTALVNETVTGYANAARKWAGERAAAVRARLGMA